MPYEVSTPVYEGPFDLLLHLIAKQQVDIYEVSLADIVDAYLAEMEHLTVAIDLEIATEFLLIAATLVELKTRRLLPGADDSDLDEEFALFEQRDLLLARLLECKTFKDAAAAIAALQRNAARSVPRDCGPEEPFASLAPDPLDHVTALQLHAAALRALAPKPSPVVDLDHVAPVRASVRDAIESVLALIPARGAVTFRDLTEGIGERLEVIVRFLAVLELYKRGMIDIEQATNFGALTVRAMEHDEPRAVDYGGLDEWGDDELDVPDTDDEGER
jgi:segregation and condensation protein A